MARSINQLDNLNIRTAISDSSIGRGSPLEWFSQLEIDKNNKRIFAANSSRFYLIDKLTEDRMIVNWILPK